MFLCDRECVERSDARGFLTFFNGKAFTQPAGNGELSVHDGKRSAQEEQITGVRRLDISPQRRRRSRQHDSKFAQARTQTIFGCDSIHKVHCLKFRAAIAEPARSLSLSLCLKTALAGI